MMHVRLPLSLRNVEDLLHERGIDVCHESVRLWVDRFGTHFAGKIRKQRANYMRQVTQWQWHLDEMFVKINGVQHYLWRAVDHEGEMYRTRDQTRADVFDYIERFYNPTHRHSTLGYLSPMQYEEEAMEA